MGLLIPETAGIRGDLVSQDDLALVAAELDLKVHQVDAQAVKIFLCRLVNQDVGLMPGPELFAVTGFSILNVDSSRLRVVDDLFLQFSILRQTAFHVLDLRGKLIKP